MGFFSKKNQDNQDTSSQVQQNQQWQNDSGIPEPQSQHAVPGLPQNDQTVQNANIDGILPAHTETGHEKPLVNQYNGFSNTAPPVQSSSDDQTDFIMTEPTTPVQPVQDQLNKNYPSEPVGDQTWDYDAPTEEPPTNQDPQVVPEKAEPNPDYQPTEQREQDSQSFQDDIKLDELEAQTGMQPTPTDTNLDDLANIKQQALHQLTPLAAHLDQSPEEKFHTTMMMLQATDDQNLIKVAFDAANAITDEKTRAQALLDVINEINYFTQNK